MTFVVVSDPPWEEKGGGKIKRGADRHYPLMKVTDIRRYHIRHIPLGDGLLFLWTTRNFLFKSEGAVPTGFDYVTDWAWVKPRVGLGQWSRSQHEHLLMFRRGKVPIPPPTNRRPSVITADTTIHSAKPEAAWKMIEATIAHLPPGPRIELFARSYRPYWTNLAGL